jgi:hypothetical protein
VLLFLNGKKRKKEMGKPNLLVNQNQNGGGAG